MSPLRGNLSVVLEATVGTGGRLITFTKAGSDGCESPTTGRRVYVHCLYYSYTRRKARSETIKVVPTQIFLIGSIALDQKESRGILGKKGV